MPHAVASTTKSASSLLPPAVVGGGDGAMTPLKDIAAATAALAASDHSGAGAAYVIGSPRAASAKASSGVSHGPGNSYIRVHMHWAKFG